MTRGVVASPANYLTPTSMAATAAKLAEDFECMSLKVSARLPRRPWSVAWAGRGSGRGVW